MSETKRVVLALDAMGSDRGPSATVAGAARVSLLNNAPDVLLVGDASVLHAELDKVKHEPSRLRIVHALEVVAQDEKPQTALAEKKDCSILRAVELVRSGEADALVSAGNTGAVTLACARGFTRLPGVSRAALGAVYPTERRRGEKDDPFSLILDAGLTLEASAEDLVAFAIMGSAYSSRISRHDKPRVALLSVGSEEGKGTPAVVAAHARLKTCPGIEFIGNVEGMDIPRGTADVIVTGGFVGNIVLKMLEGVSDTVMRLARYAGEKSLQYRAGLALLSPAIKRVRQVTDWEQYGGAPILGFDRLCIKAHGRSTERAIGNALRVAQRTASTQLVDAMREGLAKAGLE